MKRALKINNSAYQEQQENKNTYIKSSNHNMNISNLNQSQNYQTYKERQLSYQKKIITLSQQNKRLKQFIHFKQHMLEPKQIMNYHPHLGVTSAKNSRIQCSQENQRDHGFNNQQIHQNQNSIHHFIDNKVYITGTMKVIGKKDHTNNNMNMKKEEILENYHFHKNTRSHPNHVMSHPIYANTNPVQQQISRTGNVVSFREYNQHINIGSREDSRPSISQETKTPEPSFNSLKKMIADHYKNVFKGSSQYQIESQCQKVMEQIQKEVTPINSIKRLCIHKQQQQDQRRQIQIDHQQHQQQQKSSTSFSNMQTPKKSLNQIVSSKKAFGKKDDVYCDDIDKSKEELSQNTLEMMNSHINSSSENIYLTLNQEIRNQIKRFVKMVEKSCIHNDQSKNTPAFNSKKSLLRNKYLDEGQVEGQRQQQGDLNIEASLKNVQESFKQVPPKNSKKIIQTQKQNDENQNTMGIQSKISHSHSNSNLNQNQNSNLTNKSKRPYGHFRGQSYTQKQLVKLKYTNDIQIVPKHYYNNSCLSTPINQGRFSQISNIVVQDSLLKLKDLQNKHPIKPNTQWNISPENKVYTQKWKAIAENTINYTAQRNNSIKNRPYI